LANIKSAEKRARQSLKARSRNKVQKTKVKNIVKEVRQAAEAGSAESAQTALKQAMRTIAQATSKGVFPRKTASRKISRLSRLISKIKQA